MRVWSLVSFIFLMWLIHLRSFERGTHTGTAGWWLLAGSMATNTKKKCTHQIERVVRRQRRMKYKCLRLRNHRMLCIRFSLRFVFIYVSNSHSWAVVPFVWIISVRAFLRRACHVIRLNFNWVFSLTITREKNRNRWHDSRMTKTKYVGVGSYYYLFIWRDILIIIMDERWITAIDARWSLWAPNKY